MQLCVKPGHVDGGCKPKAKKKISGTHEVEQMRVCRWQEGDRCFFGIYNSFKKVEFRNYEPGNSMLFFGNIEGEMAFV